MSLYVVSRSSTVCFWLLWQHRNEDVKMSSVWECTRNDIAANVSVLIVTVGVALTGLGWTDLVN